MPKVQLLLGAFCIGLAPIFVKLIHLGPTVIGFYRCSIAGALLLPFFIHHKISRKEKSAPSNPTLFWIIMVLTGLVFAIDLSVWHRSVIYAGAGLSTILANTQVFYLALLGVLFLNEKITPRFVLAVILACAGIVLLVKNAQFNRRTLLVRRRLWTFYRL